MEYDNFILSLEKSANIYPVNGKTPTQPITTGEIKKVAKSLRLIIRFYRLFGFSFSGIVFNASAAQLANPRKQSFTGRISFLFWRTFFILITISTLCFYLFPLLKLIHDRWISPPNPILQSTNPNHSQTLAVDNFFSIDDRQEAFSDLKPILRHIIESITYVLLANVLLNLLLNLFIGGRLIRHLADMPSIKAVHFETDCSVGLKLLLGQCSLSVAIVGISVFIFNGRIFAIFYNYCFSQAAPPVEDVYFMGRVALMGVFNLLQFMNLSVYPTLFLYSMIVYYRQITTLSRGIESVELEESSLYRMRAQLTTLSVHFKATLSHFGLPLTCDMASNALLIIGTSCFLLINKSSERYYLASIFQVGAFALTRLIAVCWAGNLAASSYQSLIRVIYESVGVWGLDEWLSFVEIKRIGKQFRAVVCGTFTVRQSAILTVLGFVLNYIVILLQTENYGGTEGCNCTNSTE